MSKRIFCISSTLTALVLVFTLAMPFPVLADEGQPGDPTPQPTEVQAEEPAADAPVVAVTEEPTPEAIAEVVEALAANDSVLVDQDGTPMALTSEDAADMLANGDPWFDAGGGVIVGYSSGATCAAAVTECHALVSAPVQAAINDARSTGTTITLEPGVYTEQIVINKTLTLQGIVGATIQSPATLSTSFGTKKAIILVTGASDVTLAGLTVDGAGLGNANYQFIGVAYYNSSGTISGNTVTGITDTPLSGMQGGVAIYVYNQDGTPRTVTIDGNEVTDYQKGGIVVNGDGLAANISNNDVQGQGATSLIGANGIQVSRGATGVISGNTVTGNAWTGTYGGSNDPTSDPNADGSAGILLYFSGSGVEISSNVLTGNQFGIWTVGAPSVNIHDNTITGFTPTGHAYPTGIAIWSRDMWSETGASTTATITLNRITGHDYGILVNDPGGTHPMGVSINGNDLSGNEFGVYNMTAETLDATGNFWGDASGPYDDSNLLADVCELALENVTASGSQVSGCVVYDPWLSAFPATPNGSKGAAHLWYWVNVLAGSADYTVTPLKRHGKLDLYGIEMYQIGGAIALQITSDGEMPTLSITMETSQPQTMYVMLSDGSHYALPTSCTPAGAHGFHCTALYTPTNTEAALNPVFCLHE